MRWCLGTRWEILLSKECLHSHTERGGGTVLRSDLDIVARTFHGLDRGPVYMPPERLYMGMIIEMAMNPATAAMKTVESGWIIESAAADFSSADVS